jgi:hypothetical protein
VQRLLGSRTFLSRSVLETKGTVPVLEQVTHDAVELSNVSNTRATFTIHVPRSLVAVFVVSCSGVASNATEVVLGRGKSSSLTVRYSFIATATIQQPIHIVMQPRNISMFLFCVGNSDVSYELDAREVELGAVIGAGATCTVYKSRWRGVDVAVKRIIDSAVEARIESKMLCALLHPNIVVFYGVARAEGVVLIVTEFVGCGSLQALLANSNIEMPWWMRTRMAYETAVALAYLHDQQVIHRDL